MKDAGMYGDFYCPRLRSNRGLVKFDSTSLASEFCTKVRAANQYAEVGGTKKLNARLSQPPE
eukprot:12903522-Prorocentrum_lima.AAC.1